VPNRAFVQAYGFLPAGETKFDYAFYVGNSRNINSDPLKRGRQTGIDTTKALLVGGRLGIRHQELKLGLSATYEKRNDFAGLAQPLQVPQSKLKGLGGYRFGGDFSYNFSKFAFESEFISADIDEGIPELDLSLNFYYTTLGYHVTEQWFLYGSYWLAISNITMLIPDPGRGNRIR
jgi:hypothetical protein